MLSMRIHNGAVKSILCASAILAAIATAGLMVVGAGRANADPNKGSVLGCDVYVPGQGTYNVGEGTTITITYPDGTKEKFRCSDGKWVKVPARVGNGLVYPWQQVTTGSAWVIDSPHPPAVRAGGRTLSVVAVRGATPSAAFRNMRSPNTAAGRTLG